MPTRIPALPAWLLQLTGATLLLAAVGQSIAQDTGATVDGDPNTEAAVTVEEAGVDNTISQEQLREALIDLLAADQEEDQPDMVYSREIMEEWEIARAAAFGDELEEVVAAFPQIIPEVGRTLALTTDPDKGWGAGKILLILAAIVILGLIVERFTTRRLLRRLYDYVDKLERTLSLKIRYITARLLIQVFGIVVLGIVVFGASLYLTDHNEHLEVAVNVGLMALVKFRLWLVLLDNLLAPKHPTLRPLPADDGLARTLMFWFAGFFAIIEFGSATREYLMFAGADNAVINASLVIYTVALQAILLSRIWVHRRAIEKFFTSPDVEPGQRSFIAAFGLYVWPWLLTAWLVALWLTWMYKVFLGEYDDARFITYSWWITIAFPVIDRLFHGAVRNVVNVGWLQSPTFEVRSKRFRKVAQIGLRLMMFSFALFLLSEAGGYRTGFLVEDTLAQKILGRAVDVLTLLVFAYVVWELLYALIERKFPPEKEPDAIAALEGDAGGAGASRAETLLPLIRSFLSVVIVTFLVLSIMHTLGIAIGPLIAGAGVIGIAIGFGAQKLVQDVLSGVFFLLDDAFRKGEYVELQGLKGTVEKISLRSMQLRHHLGAVQTVPYGGIQTVKNLSRDWVTMKLELRLDYETDIEKVRKIIKKVGQSMLQDPEMGPSFILPLKSQGVMRVEESALIVRMKFTARPGEQWVIRREAYRRVRDALGEAGIHFAHREVRVRLPDDDANDATPPATPATGDATPNTTPNAGDSRRTLAEAAAAAATGVIASEALKQGKFDDPGDEM